MCVRARMRACVRVWVGGWVGACVCVRARGRAVYVCACVCCFVGADGCIPLIMLVDVCQYRRLLMFVCLPLFETRFLLKTR